MIPPVPGKEKVKQQPRMRGVFYLLVAAFQE